MLEHVARHFGTVVDRRSVGHRGHRGKATGCRRAEPGRDRFLLGKAGVAQMNVRIDQSRHDPASGRVDYRRIFDDTQPARPLDSFDAALGDKQITGLVDFARRIDKPPTAQQDSAHPASSPCLNDSTIE